MTALALVITKAGLDRFTAAQLVEDIDLTVAKVGFTAAAFVAAPTLTALPGEFRRVSTVSGAAVGDDIVHMVVRDSAEIAYTVRGFGLFLADGTLFASYSSAAPIVEKSVVTTLHLAIDIAFPTSDVKQLTFGSTDFLVPPATTERRGIVELATEAEAAEGTDPSRVASVLVMARVIATWIGSALDGRLGNGAPTEWARGLLLAATAGAGRTALGLGAAAQKAADFYAEAGRKVTGAGLATGGGDLSADRTITVEAATAAEADAAAVTTKALTPASIVNLVAAVRNRVRLSRRIDTAGLATGGGSLEDDRTVTVPAATAAQVRAGNAGDVAATPAALGEAGAVYVVSQQLQQNGGFRVWSDGLKECWGQIGVPANGTASVVLPVAHTAWVAPSGGAGAIGQDEQMLGILNVGLGGFDVRNRNPMAATFYWHTKGV